MRDIIPGEGVSGILRERHHLCLADIRETTYRALLKGIGTRVAWERIGNTKGSAADLLP
jgi:hypothetical protein